MTGSMTRVQANGASFKHRRKLSGKDVAGQTVLYIVLLFCLIIAAYPLVWLFYSSFKPQKEIFDSAFALPKNFNFINYLHIWGSSSFPRYYLNSLLVTTVSVIGTIALSTMAGYVFARIHFKYKNLLFSFLIAGMTAESNRNRDTRRAAADSDVSKRQPRFHLKSLEPASNSSQAWARAQKQGREEQAHTPVFAAHSRGHRR